jgi:hypothetical protein
VHHKTSPSRLLIEPSCTIAGAQAPVAAAGPPPPNSALRRPCEPRQPPSIFPRTHGSFLCSTWLSPVLSLTAVRVSAGALPLAGDFSGRTTATNQSLVSPTDDPHSMFTSPCPTSPPASSPPLSGPRGESRGYSCEDFKSSRVCSVKRFFTVLCLGPTPCKID